MIKNIKNLFLDEFVINEEIFIDFDVQTTAFMLE